MRLLTCFWAARCPQWSWRARDWQPQRVLGIVSIKKKAGDTWMHKQGLYVIVHLPACPLARTPLYQLTVLHSLMLRWLQMIAGYTEQTADMKNCVCHQSVKLHLSSCEDQRAVIITCTSPVTAAMIPQGIRVVIIQTTDPALLKGSSD